MALSFFLEAIPMWSEISLVFWLFALGIVPDNFFFSLLVVNPFKPFYMPPHLQL